MAYLKGDALTIRGLDIINSEEAVIKRTDIFRDKITTIRTHNTCSVIVFAVESVDVESLRRNLALSTAFVCK